MASRTRNATHLGLSLVLVAGAVLLRGTEVDVVGSVLALLSGTLFGLCALVLLWQVVRPQTMTVTYDGIRVGRAVVPWRDVVQVTWYQQLTNRFVVLLLTPEAAGRRYASLGGLRRRVVRLDQAYIPHPHIAFGGAYVRIPELVWWLETVGRRAHDALIVEPTNLDVEP